MRKLDIIKYRMPLTILISVIGFALSGVSLSEGLRLLLESGVAPETLKAIYGVMFASIGAFMMIYFIIKPLVVLMKRSIENIIIMDVKT